METNSGATVGSNILQNQKPALATSLETGKPAVNEAEECWHSMFKSIHEMWCWMAGWTAGTWLTDCWPVEREVWCGMKQPK